MSYDLLPGYDRWLDSPFERDMDARVEDADMDERERRAALEADLDEESQEDGYD